MIIVNPVPHSKLCVQLLFGTSTAFFVRTGWIFFTITGFPWFWHMLTFNPVTHIRFIYSTLMSCVSSLSGGVTHTCSLGENWVRLVWFKGSQSRSRLRFRKNGLSCFLMQSVLFQKLFPGTYTTYRLCVIFSETNNQ